MRHSILFFVLATVALAAACEPSPAPTDPGEDQSLQAAAAPEGQINQLKDALFPESEIEDASDFFAAMKSSLAQGDTASAQDAMFDMVDLALTLFGDDELLDPAGPTTTTGALIDLIQALYQFVGFDAPDAANLQPVLDGQEDGVVGVLGPEGGTLVTPDEFAGVQFPEGAVDGDILVIIERNDVQDPSECLPTPLPQAEGCYFYDTSPDIGDVNDQDSFNEDVIVGVCLDPEANDEDYLLHKFDPENPQEGVIPLPETQVDFLAPCDNFTAMGPSSSTWLGRLADATRSTLDRHVLSRIRPAPLRAADQGLGGTVGAFSTFGWAEAGNLTIVSGDDQFGDTGSLLVEPAVIELSRAHNNNNTYQDLMGGVEVEFEVLEGGGDLTEDGQTFSTVVIDTTIGDGLGTAAVQWRLGTAGPQALVARIPGATPDSVLFTAEAADVISNVLPASTTTDFVFRGDSTATGRLVTFDVASVGSGLDSVRAEYVSLNSIDNTLSVQPDRTSPGTKTVDPNNEDDGDANPADVSDGSKVLRITTIQNGGDSIAAAYRYTLDTTEPTVQPGNVPPSDIDTEAAFLTLTVEGSIFDANDLIEATVGVFAPGGDGTCGTADDVPLDEGTGDGEVDDQSQSVLSDPNPFSVDFTIQNPNDEQESDRLYCFNVTAVDEALENTGAPDGNTAEVVVAETVVTWNTII